jgi:hypothetical protein
LAAQGKFQEIQPGLWETFTELEKLEILDNIPLIAPFANYLHLLPDPSLFPDWYETRAIRYANCGDLSSSQKIVEVALDHINKSRETSPILEDLHSLLSAYGGFQLQLLALLDCPKLGQTHQNPAHSDDELRQNAYNESSLLEYRQGFLTHLLNSLSFDTFRTFWTTGNPEVIAITSQHSWLASRLLLVTELPNGSKIPAKVISALSYLLLWHPSSPINEKLFTLPILNYRQQSFHNQMIRASDIYGQLDDGLVKALIAGLSSKNIEHANKLLFQRGYEFSSLHEIEKLIQNVIEELENIETAIDEEIVPWCSVERITEGTAKCYDKLDKALLFECLSAIQSCKNI